MFLMLVQLLEVPVEIPPSAQLTTEKIRDLAGNLPPKLTARTPFDRNKRLWGGFVLETPAGKFYIVCDSGYGEGKHFRRVAGKHGPLRLAILPIGAYEPRWFMKDQHMNPEDAVKALADCGAPQALAHHHGTFQLTDEAIDAPVTALGGQQIHGREPPARPRLAAGGVLDPDQHRVGRIGALKIGGGGLFRG